MKSQFSSILTIPVVILLFTHVFNERIIQLAFELNQNYIQNELCIKKDVQGNTCLGSCYFKDQIEKEQERKESPEYQIQKEVFYYANLQAVVIQLGVSTSKHFVFDEKYTSNYISSIIHPPPIA